MQNMARGQKGTKNYDYWRERHWLEADYYTKAPVKPWSKWMADYIATRMRAAIRKGNIKPVR